MSGIAAYGVFFACVVLILGLVTLGLNLQWGSTGLFNAGVVGFYAIGGYTQAILTAEPAAGHLGNLGWPWAAGLVAAMAVTALAAWAIGALTVRLRGDYLAITSFGIAVAIQLVTLNAQALTGGPNGLTRLAKPMAGLADTPWAFNLVYLGLLVLIVGTVYVALERMLRSPWGRVLRAIREDELAAVALGKSATRFRLEAFVIGSTLMGLAGALYVSFIGFVSPFDFLPILTFQVWAMLIVGGSGNNRGALLGALVVWGIWTLSGVAVTKLLPPSQAAQGAALQVILIGLALVLMLLYRPRGLIGE
ncbi:MAG: branched-chain amino acid ABC transporter permease, partial [Aquabacterium sp.]